MKIMWSRKNFPKPLSGVQFLITQDVDYTSNGVYEVQVEGELTIHGVTNQVSAGGSLGSY